MNKAYHFYLSVTNKVLAGILTLLGFSMVSCNTEEEYGSPYAEYEIKGKVVNEEGKAIPGIQVVLIETPSNIHSSYAFCDTLQSGSKGEFNKHIDILPVGYEQKFELRAKDIDGEDNGGLFEEETTELLFKKEDLKGASGNWYYGKATKEVTIVMKNKD